VEKRLDKEHKGDLSGMEPLADIPITRVKRGDIGEDKRIRKTRFPFLEGG